MEATEGGGDVVTAHCAGQIVGMGAPSDISTDPTPSDTYLGDCGCPCVRYGTWPAGLDAVLVAMLVASGMHAGLPCGPALRCFALQLYSVCWFRHAWITRTERSVLI